MFVRLYGVSLQVGQGMTMADVFEQLEPLEGHLFEFNDQMRSMYVDELPDYHIALFFTIKDQRKFMKMREEGGKVTVTPEEIAKNEQVVDYNFLAVNKTSGRGLYSYYKGSFAIGGLRSLLRKQHAIAMDTRRARWIEEQVEADPTANKEKLRQKSFKVINGFLNLDEIVDKTSFEEFLSRVDSMKTLQVDTVGMADDDDGLQPLKKGVEKMRKTYVFKPDLPGRSFIAPLMKWIEKTQPEDVKVEGKIGPVRRKYDLFNPVAEIFGEFDFDQIAAPIDPDHFDTTPMLQEMVAFIEKYPAVFA